VTTEILAFPKYRLYCADSGDLEGSKLRKIMNGNSMEGEFFSFSFPCEFPTQSSPSKGNQVDVKERD